jgi:hypothetical protein
MTDFSAQDLQLLEQTAEVHLDRGQRSTIIWVVVVDQTVYIRSVRGETGKWYQALRAGAAASLRARSSSWPIQAAPVDDPAEIDRVSRAIQNKYASRWPGPTASMLRPEVLPTTLRITPA